MIHSFSFLKWCLWEDHVSSCQSNQTSTCRILSSKPSNLLWESKVILLTKVGAIRSMMLTIQAQGLSVSHQWYNLLCPSTQNTLSAHYHYHIVTSTCFVMRTRQVSSKCNVVLPKISHFITTASSLLTTRAFSKVQHTRRLPRLRSTSEFQAEASKPISEAAESFTTFFSYFCLRI